MVEFIRPLYEYERELRESKVLPEQIREKRQIETARQVKKIFESIEERLKDRKNPPCNARWKVVVYTMSRREILEIWMSIPQIPIDNNQGERTVCTVTVEGNNSLFIGVPDEG